jgi:hypothetical protein
MATEISKAKISLPSSDTIMEIGLAVDLGRSILIA